jgi:hypothetical protein
MATNIIDPNDAISSQSLVNLGLNATPDYSDMFIFAELTAQRRTASILSTGGVGKPTTLDTANDAVKINLMGFDQDSGQYTTRWTENVGGGVTPFEGFGMTSINIKTDSSYVPTVDIEFIDIRGLSLVSLGVKSPYSVLYSFPPPIFKLTVKGYYGKAIQYDLHLVRSSTRFDADSGNYFINVNFIARRFAPLTDVLFKYIDIVPLMKEGITPAGDTNIGIEFNYNNPPQNTRELITRAKKLYDDLDQFKVDSKEASELNSIKQSFTDSQILVSQINNFKTFINTDLQANFDKYIFNRVGTYSNEQGANMSSNDSNAIRKINSLDVYDNAIKQFSPSESDYAKFDQRFCLLYSYDEFVNGTQDNVLSDAVKAKIMDEMKSLQKILLREGQKVNSKIPNNSIEILNGTEIQPFNKKKYIGMDITNFYLYVRQDLVKKQQDYVTKNKIFKDKISDLATRTIGFTPTIKNIFGVLTRDTTRFFNDLRDVCKQAETQHKNNFDQIVSNNKTKAKFISAFPLILKTTVVNDSSGSGNGNPITRNERAYPGEKGLGFETAYFPEVDFVENFITTFINVIKSDQIANLKESIDADGNNKWLPINPLDSVVNGRLNADSPYKGIFNVLPTTPGGSSILSELINRLYVSSQYSYGFLFYNVDGAFIKDFFGAIGIDINTKNDKLIKYLAESEATNLVNSIVDANLLNSLETQITSWSQNLNGFYSTLQSSVPHYSDLSDQQDVDVNNVATTYISLNGQKIVKNRQSENYHGFELLFSSPVLRNKSDAGTANSADGDVNIVDRYIDEVGNNGFLNKLIFDSHGFDDFTKQNIPYIKDQANLTSTYDTDFVTNQKIIGITTGDNTLMTAMASWLGSGAVGRTNGKAIFKLLSDPNLDDHIKAYFIFNVLCATLTYYHSDNDVNKKFAFPAVIEVPKFAHLNMGAYMYLYKFISPAKQTMIDYYNQTYGKSFENLIDPDNKYAVYSLNIANNDADLLLQYFEDFISDTTENGFTSINSKLIAMINEVEALNLVNFKDRIDQYERRLEPASDLKTSAGENDYSPILQKLINKLYLLNYTQITFLPTDVADNGTLPLNYFVPLKEVNTRSTRSKQVNDNFFTQFFKKVISLCQEKKDNVNKLESSFREGIEDNDIKTQTYYSFKAIADKWVIGLDDSGAFGYSQDLIKEFAFVDRFFNDIGDKVVIDFRPLVDMSQDYDVSVFTVMARILTLNGFEFFPVQNFLNFQQDEWINSFKTYGSSRDLIKSQTPAFICMYIGGTSSQLDDPLSGYEDDGIKDERTLEQSPDYKATNVRGFKVAFAKQNQTMFKSIELNTNEHKETNESLSILSEIAQDQSAASPVPKGQNLYSTYEQRSYNCNVQGFGNALIQPTQYFILENVPMFNGAYLILKVEHNIVPNTMKTSFMGVRIRSNPNPLVTDFATSTGVKAGDSDDITNGVVNQAGVSTSAGTNRNNPNNSGNAGFTDSSVFPVNPAITNDMIGRQISPQQ